MPLARRDHMFRKENRAKNTSIGPESGAIEFEKYTGIGSESGAVGARNRNVILKEKNPLTGVNMERVTGIEPASRAWKALVLPLNYTRSARRYYRPNRRFPQSFWSAHTEWTRLRKKRRERVQDTFPSSNQDRVEDGLSPLPFRLISQTTQQRAACAQA